MNKLQLQEFFKINKYFIIGSLILIIIITNFTKTSLIFGFLTFIITTYIGYYSHYLSHNKCFKRCIKNVKLPKFVKNTILYHDSIHHDENKKELKYDIYEFLNNILTQGGLLFLIKILSRYLNGWIILLYAFCYATIHIINFKFIKPKTHSLHHDNSNCNYGYELYDILFNTKEGEIENTNHYLINFIIGTIILLLINKLFFT